MNKKTILVTGANGFIGKNFVEKLKDKYNLILPRHSELELTDEDSVNEFFRKNKVDVVVHMANIGGGRAKTMETKDIVKTNLQMFFNLAKNSKNYGKLINCGTGGEYDRRFDVKKAKESDIGKTIPVDDYSFSKYVMSKYIEDSKENIIDLRFFAVFGKYEDYELRFISSAILKNLLKLPITINQNVFFDYIYVDDVIRIIEYFIENDTAEKFYNVGTGQAIDLLSLAKHVNEISGFKSEIVIRNEGMNREFSCDNSKLMSELGNFEFTPIEDAIREMYEYYKINLPNLNLDSMIDDKYNKEDFYKKLKN